MTMPETVEEIEWTPEYITSSLWLDASDSANFTLDGSGNVTQWDDLSGNSNHAVQSGAEDLPSYNSTDDCVDFDGTEILETPNSLASLGSVEAFVVGSYSQTQTAYSYMLSGFTSGSDHRFYVAACNNGTPNQINFAVGIADTFVNYGKDVGAHIWSMFHSSATASAFEDGSLKGSETRNYTGVPIAWCLGGVNGSPRLKGKIYEVILLSSVLTSADREKIEGYLAWKWGLEANLPTDHPYKTTAPTTYAGKIPTYYLNGTVTEGSNQYIERNIRLYRYDTGELMNTTTSISGSFFITTTYSGTHYITCHDLPNGEYNDLIFGKIVPGITYD
jgi:hypothetical protein